MSSQVELLRQTIKKFTLEFIQNPYLCYTEHGQHARFYSLYYSILPPECRYLTWKGHKVCVIQKEYPTAGNLGKSRRQHWDIALIKTPPESVGIEKSSSFDYLRLAAVVEFGMNEKEDHLRDDIQRICHPDSNVEQGYIVHLYRLSKSAEKKSGRDWPNESRTIISSD